MLKSKHMEITNKSGEYGNESIGNYKKRKYRN